jgi:hypothetical protein
MVDPATVDQVFMGAYFGDRAAVENHNAIGAANG